MQFVLITIGFILAIIVPLIVLLILNKALHIKIRWWLNVVIEVASVAVIVASSSAIYFSIYYHAEAAADNYLVSTSTVEVKDDPNYYFFDNKAVTDKAAIFYIGAKVEEKSYAPLMMKVAEGGSDVFLLKIPFRFPLFSIDRADVVINHFQYSSIYLMGHSLGGICANRYALGHEKVKGMVFLASYPDKKMNDRVKGLSIYGTLDSVLNKGEYDRSSSNRSSSFEEYVIEGGNHSGFAYYGPQKGDTTPTIDRDQQIALTSKRILDFMGIRGGDIDLNDA